MGEGAHKDPWLAQRGYGVRFEWGAAGAVALSDENCALVVVDVLSFTTSVTVAVEKGMAVYPAPWRDGRAEAIARKAEAVLAVGCRQATAEHPWSLSPAAMRSAPVVPRLVLPSPNGSTIAASAKAGTVIAACLQAAGVTADVEIAAQVDVSDTVPILVDDAFRQADPCL